MRLQAYLHSAENILNAYHGEMPFAAWLKNFFKQDKKYGSRDRRLITDLCFCFFRLGNMSQPVSVQDRLLASQFLCHTDSVFIRELKPEWESMLIAAVAEKMAFLGETELPFPFPEELSAEIDPHLFGLSILEQPDLFLRIRPGKEKVVTAKLAAAGIPFQQEGSCLRLANNTKADEVILIDEDVVVQDISSQQVLQPLLEQLQKPDTKVPTSAWDCCAASGGKSILLHDLLPKTKLTASDIRESILVNLRNRFKRAGIREFRSFVADIAAPHFSQSHSFDLVICDAPCSGSGTWGRTPEQLTFFKKEKIEYYASLQKSIGLNASRSVKKGGFFLYITCSVFSRENEDVVDFLSDKGSLRLLSQRYIKGYTKKGDTLFAALFTT